MRYAVGLYSHLVNVFETEMACSSVEYAPFATSRQFLTSITCCTLWSYFLNNILYFLHPICKLYIHELQHLISLVMFLDQIFSGLRDDITRLTKKLNTLRLNRIYCHKKLHVAANEDGYQQGGHENISEYIFKHNGDLSP